MVLYCFVLYCIANVLQYVFFLVLFNVFRWSVLRFLYIRAKQNVTRRPHPDEWKFSARESLPNDLTLQFCVTFFRMVKWPFYGLHTVYCIWAVLSDKWAVDIYFPYTAYTKLRADEPQGGGGSHQPGIYGPMGYISDTLWCSPRPTLASGTAYLQRPAVQSAHPVITGGRKRFPTHTLHGNGIFT